MKMKQTFCSSCLSGVPLNLLFFRPQAKSSVKKQISQKGRKSRKQESSAEEDEDDDDDDEDDDDEEDTPKRQTRRRGATKVKRGPSKPKHFYFYCQFQPQKRGLF